MHDVFIEDTGQAAETLEVTHAATPTSSMQIEVRAELMEALYGAMEAYGFTETDDIIEAALQVYLDALNEVTEGARTADGLYLPESDFAGQPALAPDAKGLMAVSLSMILTLTQKISGRVRYQLGAKPHMRLAGFPSAVIPGGLAGDSSQIRVIDCSGFVCYVIAKATNQQWILPPGSVLQRDACRAAGLRAVDYAEVAQGGNNRLFIAFINPTRTRKIGHVWLVNAGMTLESYGGHGVGRRPWNTSVLRQLVGSCFEIPVAP